MLLYCTCGGGLYHETCTGSTKRRMCSVHQRDTELAAQGRRTLLVDHPAVPKYWFTSPRAAFAFVHSAALFFYSEASFVTARHRVSTTPRQRSTSQHAWQRKEEEEEQKENRVSAGEQMCKAPVSWHTCLFSLLLGT